MKIKVEGKSNTVNVKNEWVFCSSDYISRILQNTEVPKPAESSAKPEKKPEVVSSPAAG